MKSKCLYCYGEIEEGHDFHKSCSKDFFGSYPPPQLDYIEEEMKNLGLNMINSQIAITGVQPKLSLQIDYGNKGKPDRFTIVGVLAGQYILKPQFTKYHYVPEIENLTMRLASSSGIKTVPQSLIRLKSGALAYITKRVDRVDQKKRHLEDMCQLTERLTEHKYNGSHEQVAQAIRKYCKNSGIDLFDFFQLVLFSFLTGNADMHLKNFSLIDDEKLGYTLCPAYDLVATALIMTEDKEELALTINAKKRKIKWKDFEVAMQTAEMNPIVVANLFRKMEKSIPTWFPLIAESFLPTHLKTDYVNLIKEKAIQIGMSIK